MPMLAQPDWPFRDLIQKVDNQASVHKGLCPGYVLHRDAVSELLSAYY